MNYFYDITKQYAILGYDAIPLWFTSVSKSGIKIYFNSASFQNIKLILEELNDYDFEDSDHPCLYEIFIKYITAINDIINKIDKDNGLNLNRFYPVSSINTNLILNEYLDNNPHGVPDQLYGIRIIKFLIEKLDVLAKSFTLHTAANEIFEKTGSTTDILNITDLPLTNDERILYEDRLIGMFNEHLRTLTSITVTDDELVKRFESMPCFPVFDFNFLKNQMIDYFNMVVDCNNISVIRGQFLEPMCNVGTICTSVYNDQNTKVILLTSEEKIAYFNAFSDTDLFNMFPEYLRNMYQDDVSLIGVYKASSIMELITGINDIIIKDPNIAETMISHIRSSLNDLAHYKGEEIINDFTLTKKIKDLKFRSLFEMIYDIIMALSDDVNYYPILLAWINHGLLCLPVFRHDVVGSFITDEEGMSHHIILKDIN